MPVPGDRHGWKTCLQAYNPAGFSMGFALVRSSPQRFDCVLSIVVWCGVLPHHHQTNRRALIYQALRFFCLLFFKFAQNLPNRIKGNRLPQCSGARYLALINAIFGTDQTFYLCQMFCKTLLKLNLYRLNEQLVHLLVCRHAERLNVVLRDIWQKSVT